MKILYAPWRSEYSTAVNSEAKKEDTSKENCVFCTQLQAHTDEKYWILKRYQHNYIMLNKYPYNAGHLLILPLEHHQNFEQLSRDARAELMELISLSTQVLQKALNAQGFNIGANLGKVAGAGIPSHLHMHVLPRWSGDTNFLPVLAETKQVSFDLQKMYERLKEAF